MGRRIEDKRCKNRSGENPPHLAIGAHPEEIGVTKHLFLKYGFENKPEIGDTFNQTRCYAVLQFKLKKQYFYSLSIFLLYSFQR